MPDANISLSMEDRFNLQGETYTPVYKNLSTFKNPRQKIWAIFIVGEEKGSNKIWRLVNASNDYYEVVDLFNAWLRDPLRKTPTGEDIPTGIDNVIMAEILPTDSRTRL